jgi:hypothetical protein
MANQYPSFRYKGEAPNVESKLVHNAADDAAATKDGWRHSPDPDAIDSVDPATLPPGVIAGQPPLSKFPSFRYHKDHGQRLVQTPTEADALAKDGWVETPADFDELSKTRAVTTPPTPKVAPTPPFDPNVAPPVAPTDDEQAKAEQLHATNTADVVAMLDTITDPEQLMRIRAREAQNPKHEGGRIGVNKAINERLNALMDPDGARG